MALAQSPLPTPAPPAATGDAAADAADGPAPRELEALIETIEDPAERAELLDQLRALRDVVPAPEPEQPAPDLVAATVIDEFATEVRRRTDDLFDIIGDVISSTDQLPELVYWLQAQATDREQRTVWIAVVGALFAILAVGLVARLLVLRMRPPLDSEHPRRTGFGRFVVELAAAMIFAALTQGVLWLLNILAVAYAFDLAVIANAALALGFFLFVAMLWGATVRLLFGERGSTVRLLAIPDTTAQHCQTGLLRIGRLGFIGFGLLYAFFILGLPESVFTFLLHLLFLTVEAIAIVLVIRMQEPVGQGIVAWAEGSNSPLARFMPARFLARTWHYFAILLIVLHYLVWALDVPGGVFFLTRATIMTIAILVLARLAALWVNRVFESGVPLGDGDELLPGVQERANRYAAPVRLLLRTTVILLALLAILSAWNTGAVEWLRSPTGQAFLGLIGRLAVIIGLAVLAFEITSFVANRFANEVDEAGKPVRSNRARTLAGIMANVTYFVVGMAALFTALSNIGVEAAPLLAGAGVVGLAIGFGAQTLVRDLITGLFMLLGDIIRVGDVVEIAGKAGVVEGMSMRTITLRSYDGGVHTVPYGSVDVVTNLTRDFSFAVLEIGVAYRENTDEVIRLVREIDDRMRKEWPYRRLILEPIDVAGVEMFGDSAVMIRMRSKTRPGEQWGIRREFLRRIKLRFDEVGIEIPFPHQTVYFGAGKEGQAPPLRIQELSRNIRPAEGESEAAAESEPVVLPGVSGQRGGSA